MGPAWPCYLAVMTQAFAATDNRLNPTSCVFKAPRLSHLQPALHRLQLCILLQQRGLQQRALPVSVKAGQASWMLRIAPSSVPTSPAGMQAAAAWCKLRAGSPNPCMGAVPHGRPAVPPPVLRLQGGNHLGMQCLVVHPLVNHRLRTQLPRTRAVVGNCGAFGPCS